MRTVKFILLAFLAFFCGLVGRTDLASAEELGRLKRYILRDCSGAESIFLELAPTERPELIRYLGEVFKLKLGALFEAPLVAGNLADPADIWRSLSGESDVDSKLCALKLALKIGPAALDSLAQAVPLLKNPLIPAKLKSQIVATALELIAATPLQVSAHNFIQLRQSLQLVSNGVHDVTALNTAAVNSSRTILYFALDSSVIATGNGLTAAIESAPLTATSAGAGSAESTAPLSTVKAKSGKVAGKIDRRILFRALASSVELEREQALAQLTAADIKSLTGFRATAARPERVAASLAISHLGGSWQLDTASSRNVDCGFVASFLPLTAPQDAKRFEDFERLIGRCLLVGLDEFLAQVVATPQLAQGSTIQGLIPAELSLDLLSTPQRLSIVLIRLSGNSDSRAQLSSLVSAMFEAASEVTNPSKSGSKLEKTATVSELVTPSAVEPPAVPPPTSSPMQVLPARR